MSKLFNRSVIVQVGSDNTAIQIPTDFKIEFNIQKLINGNSSEGSVSIYNLADSTKATILANQQRVRVFAGYGDQITLLHDGDILRTSQVDEQANKKTILYFGNTVYTTNSATFTKSYTNTISIRQIVADALPTLNIPFNNAIVNAIPAGATLPNFSFHGKTVDALEQLLPPFSLQWFERNGEALFSKKGAALQESGDDVFVLNSNTGLIKTAEQTDRGVNATCLLNGQLQVGKIVKIESDVVQQTALAHYTVQKKSDSQGFYKIIQATYSGDNWDGKFEVLLQCVPYDASQTQSTEA